MVPDVIIHRLPQSISQNRTIIRYHKKCQMERKTSCIQEQPLALDIKISEFGDRSYRDSIRHTVINPDELELLMSKNSSVSYLPHVTVNGCHCPQQM